MHFAYLKKLNTHGMLFASGGLVQAWLDLLLLQEAQGREGSFKGYKLMTSVSIPVYNKKNHTVSEAHPFLLLLLNQQWPQSVYVYVLFISEQHQQSAPSTVCSVSFSLFRPLKCWGLSQMKLQTRLGRFGNRWKTQINMCAAWLGGNN